MDDGSQRQQTPKRSIKELVQRCKQLYRELSHTDKQTMRKLQDGCNLVALSAKSRLMAAGLVERPFQTKRYQLTRLGITVLDCVDGKINYTNKEA